MADYRSLLESTAGLAWVAIRTFLATLLLLTVAGSVLAGCAYYALREQPLYGVLAAALALLEALAAGVMLGGRRALVAASGHGLRKFALGRSSVRFVFERLLGVSPEQVPGERAGRVARTLERLPLAQAEQRLRDIIGQITAAPPGGGGVSGWLRRRVQAALFGLVGKYTLARFRQEGADEEGVNLVKVQADLEERIDDLLAAKLRGGVSLWTWIVVVGLPLLVLAQTYALSALVRVE